MPALSFFVDDQDVKVLVERLNADPEIAFIVANGPLSPPEVYLERVKASMGGGSKNTFYTLADTGYRQRWKAIRTVDRLEDGAQSLWHVPTGPLPLLVEAGPDDEVSEPWQGWTEQRSGADPTVPYFGPGCHAEIRLELWTRYRAYSEAEKAKLPVLNSLWNQDRDMLVVSDFQWIGGHYAPAPPQTRNWWNRQRTWLDRSATRIADQPPIFWAFPSALEKLKHGMAYHARGWDLDEGIRLA